MKHFTSAHDVADIDYLIKRTLAFKENRDITGTEGRGKRLGLLFQNPSMRTRISTQIAAHNLGMETIVFNIDKEGWQLELTDGAIMNGTSVEHIKDAAPVLGSYFDILGVRTFPALTNRNDDNNEELINALRKYAGVPVLSLESTTVHPLQSLTDLATIAETHTSITKPRVVLLWAPHVKPLPQCVPNSFAEWAIKWNKADLVIANPPGYDLNDKYTKGAAQQHNPEDALKGADFVYVKSWSAYNEYGTLPQVSGDWLLNEQLMKLTNNARVMHCLPVRRNVELADEILDSPDSLVTQQASNRVWAAQAVLSELLKQTK